MLENELIAKARDAATRAHEGQKRRYGGEDYITHPAAVVRMIADAPFATAEMVAAAWLHDVVEDTAWTIQEVYEEFGAEVGTLVQQLTNPSKKYSTFPRAKRKEMDREHSAKVSINAKTIKCADRIHNLRGILAKAPDEFAKLYLFESVQLWRALDGADPELYDELWQVIVGGLGMYLETAKEK